METTKHFIEICTDYHIIKSESRVGLMKNYMLFSQAQPPTSESAKKKHNLSTTPRLKLVLL